MAKNSEHNLSANGYQIVKYLGCNHSGGRTTYLATDLQSNLVVIKQFQFARTAEWSGYKAVEREIQVLKSLDHPQIPKCIEALEVESGFCLVQEFIEADNLAVPRSLTVEEIQIVAISLLKILVYLQERYPPVSHRDIKPENILLDSQLNVFLVDFGLAKVGSNVAESSMIAGTLGFMPPEQLWHRTVTKGSDLYGVGATLICLLTGTKSINISDLLDEQFRIRFKHLVPSLNPQFICWLQKMIEPKLSDRFQDASSALNALLQVQLCSSLAKSNKKLIKIGNLVTIYLDLRAVLMTGAIALTSIAGATYLFNFGSNQSKSTNKLASCVLNCRVDLQLNRHNVVLLEVFLSAITTLTYVILYLELKAVLSSSTQSSLTPLKFKFSLLCSFSTMFAYWVDSNLRH